MVKKENKEKNHRQKSYINYILVGALIVAAFAVGHFYTKVKILEKGTQEKSGKNQPTKSVSVKPEVFADDPSLGPEDAKVTLIEFSDFLCPFCGAFSGENKKMVEMMRKRDSSWEAPLPNIKRDYIDKGKKVRIVWKDAPFHGEQAFLVHAAARCAKEQGKFWEFHNYIFSKLGESKDEFTKESLKKIAGNLALESDDFDKCIDSDKYTSKMQEALSYVKRVGVDGTPATFVNGKLVSGAVSYSQFKKMIDDELNK